MKKFPILLLFAILVLFIIQSAGTLVESIYILDLMNSNLDEKALGVLFFFAPLLFIPFHKKYPQGLVWVTYAVVFLGRGSLPHLNTANRMLASGLATAAGLSLFFLLLKAKTKGEAHSKTGLWGSAGLALAISLSVLFRTAGLGLDLSLIPAGAWIGWALGLLLGWLLTQLEFEKESAKTKKKRGSPTFPVVGIYLVLTLIWFSFSAPAVIARWTEGNYALIVITISLFAVGWVFVSIARPGWLTRISPRVLVLWNLFFTLFLTGTLLAHRVPFPPTPDSAAVIVRAPGLLQQIPLFLMLVLFPVVFFDMRAFLDQIRHSTPRDLLPGILLGSFILILLIFAHIFTNVWGYVKPVSLVFRDKFWLSYLLAAGIIILLVWRVKGFEPGSEKDPDETPNWGWAVLLGGIFLGTAIRALPMEQVQVDALNRASLVVMTFNTQQSNDDFGERSFDEQLALIRRVSPDILALQESDSARISLNNNDYVRYFAGKLGYYSYYGPTTVTGTFGTAILSRFPLENARTVFTYSDKDEIGVAEAELEVNGRRFTIYNVHPDGSDTAMLAFAKSLLERSKDEVNVIALGDYNLRDYEEAYQLIDGVYTNAWVAIYPSEISADGVDMSGENRIDHIFVSSALGVRNPVYVLPPASATDHPVHWAEVYWEKP